MHHSSAQPSNSGSPGGGRPARARPRRQHTPRCRPRRLRRYPRQADARKGGCHDRGHGDPGQPDRPRASRAGARRPRVHSHGARGRSPVRRRRRPAGQRAGHQQRAAQRLTPARREDHHHRDRQPETAPGSRSATRAARRFPSWKAADDALAEGGRGLRLVSDLAARWDYRRDAAGLVTWFEVGAEPPS